ncbi:MAG: PilZ domain-containing protein [Nannocystaceae bacterium]|nr:PilZ domain-containing protein [Nannocystaceae bacterium]
MGRRPSWLNLRAIADGPRTLRVRGSEVRDAFVDHGPHEAARLRLAIRESLSVGEAVSLEISFGPMVDEVTVEASVASITVDADSGTTHVVVSIAHSEHGRATYVREVLTGTRSASARRHRRVPVDIEVRWTSNGNRYASRVRDLSRGGAFIESQILPIIGAKVDVELRLPEGPATLALDGEVAWLRTRTGKLGFGVCFKLPDRGVAARLHDAVRECEITFGT